MTGAAVALGLGVAALLATLASRAKAREAATAAVDDALSDAKADAKAKAKKKKPSKPTAAKPADDKPKPAAQPIPTEPVTLKESKAPAPAPQKKSKKEIAERFYQYVTREIREGRSANLGSKDRPNMVVLQAQQEMGGLKEDGIYGDKTRKRGKELTGKEWPVRRSGITIVPVEPKPAATAEPKPQPATKEEIEAAAMALAQAFGKKREPAKPKPAPKPAAKPKPAPAVKRTPVQAANDLYAYAKAVLAAKEGWKLGTRDKPSETVRSAQADMGELTADGIYGPKTKARGKALTGKDFPTRVANS